MRICGLACALFALACGDIKTAGDGGPSDSGTPDARAVGSVSVTLGTLFGDAQPLAGNRVVFVDTAGALAGDLVTDDAGQATADGIEAGSTMILFIDASAPAGAPAGSQAIVVVGVEPGDDIHIEGEPDEGAVLGDMNVTWPARTGGGNYHISVGCNSAGPTTDTTVAMTFSEACVADGTAQALIRAADDTDATLGWVGGTATFASPGTLDVAGPWGDPGALAVELSGIPSEARRVFPRFTPWRDAVAFNQVSLPELQLLAAATANFDVPIPRAFATSDLVTLDFQANQTTLGGNSLAVRVAPDATALALDLGDELLPWLGFPVLDTPNRALRWTRTAGREPDAQFLAMFWSEKSGEGRATFIMLPPDRDEVVMPELPAEFEPFMPVSPSEVHIQLIAGESSELDGYRAARQRGFELIFNDSRLGLEAPSTLRRSFAGADL